MLLFSIIIAFSFIRTNFDRFFKVNFLTFQNIGYVDVYGIYVYIYVGGYYMPIWDMWNPSWE